jgi:hypothetical protein
MARVFGILLVVAGLGYLADGFGAVLVSDYSISIGQFTFIGEVALIFWLLIKGSRKDFSHGEADQGHQLDTGLLVSTPVGMNPQGRSASSTLERS